MAQKPKKGKGPVDDQDSAVAAGNEEGASDPGETVASATEASAQEAPAAAPAPAGGYKAKTDLVHGTADGKRLAFAAGDTIYGIGDDEIKVMLRNGVIEPA